MFCAVKSEIPREHLPGGANGFHQKGMDVNALLDRLRDAARRAGFVESCFGHREDFPLVAFERRSTQARARVYLSSGVHGDEPAGPMALLELLRRNSFRDDVEYSILPVINPLGLQAGTRENGDGVDINRSYGPVPTTPEAKAHQSWLEDRRFDLAVCLHEDYEVQGFYLYELSPVYLPDRHAARTNSRPSPARALLSAGAAHLPVELQPWIDEMPNEKGLMQPPRDHLHSWVEALPEAIHLLRRHTPWCFTTETPSRAAPIVDRIACQCALVNAAMHWVVDESAMGMDFGTIHLE